MSDEKRGLFGSLLGLTFYRLQTIKGSVQLRWFGESNGCYSESVEFEQVASAA